MSEAKKDLGLFAVFYDGETRPVAGFVLEQDAERYAKTYAGDASYEVKHVRVIPDSASVGAQPAPSENERKFGRIVMALLQNDFTEAFLLAREVFVRAAATPMLPTPPWKAFQERVESFLLSENEREENDYNEGWNDGLGEVLWKAIPECVSMAPKLAAQSEARTIAGLVASKI